MSFAQKIYNASPVFVQHALISLYGLQWNKRRFGGIFKEQLKQFKARESYTSQQWEAYTGNCLQAILLHAFQNIPYYNKSWNAAGLSIEDLKNITPDTISKLPFLEKDDLRKYGKTSLLSPKKESGGSFFDSSGSTGTPTSILFSKAMHQRWSAAYEARVRHWAGVDRYMSRGMIGGRRVLPVADAPPPFYRYNIFEKQAYFSAYHISPANAPHYAKALQAYRPAYMAGYAMSNYFLARLIKEQGLKVPTLKAVITSSEKLTQEMREVFSDVYKCKTFDGWSGVEACALVSECEHGGLHISPDVGLIELLDKNGEPVKPGEAGEVVCTGFLNFDQPLIRYRISDYMVLSAKQCPCGRQMPLIDDIIGRMEDVVVTKDGRELVRFHGIFTGILNIMKGQVMQEDVNNITLNIVSSVPLTEREKNTLQQRIYSQLGEVNVYISELNEIPAGANGKFRAVISKVKRHNL